MKIQKSVTYNGCSITGVCCYVQKHVIDALEAFSQFLANGVGKVLVYSEESMVNCSVVLKIDSQDTFIYCCTNTGNFYKVNLSSIQDTARSRSSSPPSSLEDEDVFSDLLDSDEFVNGIELSIATKPVYTLKSCDLLHSFNCNIRGFCVAKEFVVIACRTGSEREVCVYRENDLGKAGSLETIRIFTLNNPCNYQIENKHEFEQTILVKCLISAQISIDSQSSDSIIISASLYKAIVGQDVCLLGSPTIVVGPPDGSVYFAPIKGLDLSDRNVSAASTSMRDDYRHGFSQFRILCETTSQVVFLDAMKIKSSSDDEETDTGGEVEVLVICCQNGLVSLMTDLGKQMLLQTQTFSIDSPVRCVCSFRNKLYHSTGRYVCETTVSCTRVRGDKFVVKPEIRRFQLSGVEDMLAYIPEASIQTDDAPCMIYCHHVDGQESKYNFTEELTEYQPNTSGNLSETMKETLISIESVDRKKDKIEKDLKQYEYLLRQINIAATLFREYDKPLGAGLNLKRKVINKDSRVLVPCRFKARLPEGEMRDDILIDCEVTNQMSLSLSYDWIVMVTVEPANRNEDSVTRTFKLNKEFCHSHCLTLTIPINPRWILSEMVATVSLVLAVNFRTELEQRDKRSEIAITVPVHQEKIDVFYFIHADNNEVTSIDSRYLQSSLLGNQLRHIAKTRPVGGILLEDGTESDQKTVCVNASVYLNRQKVVWINKEFDASDILNYLLENPRTTQTYQAENGCYRTYLGTPIYLNVTVNQSREGTEEITLAAVSIRSNLATAAAVHMAVQQRLQLLCTDLNIPPLYTEKARRKLYQIQDLENELSQLQADKQTDIGRLASLYEKLRKIITLDIQNSTH